MDKSRNTNNALSHNRFETMTANPSKQSTLLPANKAGVEAWLEKMNSTVDKSDDYRGMGSVYLELKPVKGLTLSAKGSVDFSQGNQNVFTPSTFDKQWHENRSEGDVLRTIAVSNEELIRYNASFKEKHNLDILLGFNAERNAVHAIGGWGKGSVSDYVYYYNPNLTVEPLWRRDGKRLVLTNPLSPKRQWLVILVVSGTIINNAIWWRLHFVGMVLPLSGKIINGQTFLPWRQVGRSRKRGL